MMLSDLFGTTALRTTLDLEAILSEHREKSKTKFNMSEKDRVVYIFHCFEVDESGEKIDMGYEMLSPSTIEDELILLPYPLEEDLFSNIDIDNDLDNTRQLETIIGFLKSNNVSSIFTGLLPKEEYFMGTSYALENYDEDTITYLEPLKSQRIKDYMGYEGVKLINCGNLPDTFSNKYLN